MTAFEIILPFSEKTQLVSLIFLTVHAADFSSLLSTNVHEVSEDQKIETTLISVK